MNELTDQNNSACVLNPPLIIIELFYKECCVMARVSRWWVFFRSHGSMTHKQKHLSLPSELSEHSSAPYQARCRYLFSCLPAPRFQVPAYLHVP